MKHCFGVETNYLLHEGSLYVISPRAEIKGSLVCVLLISAAQVVHHIPDLAQDQESNDAGASTPHLIAAAKRKPPLLVRANSF